MSDRVIDQTIAELQAILRGQQLAADGTAEQHDRWTRTAAMMLGTAVDVLVSERDRADAAAARIEAVRKICIPLPPVIARVFTTAREQGYADGYSSLCDRVIDALDREAVPHG